MPFGAVCAGTCRKMGGAHFSRREFGRNMAHLPLPHSKITSVFKGVLASSPSAVKAALRSPRWTVARYAAPNPHPPHIYVLA